MDKSGTSKREFQVLDYYSKPLVKTEIFNYGRGRWIAIEGSSQGRVFVRYGKSDKPLKLEEPDDVIKLLRSFWFLKPRTLYGSLNKYKVISEKEDVENTSNILYTTSTWDIDNEVERWQETIGICKIILQKLEEEGITKSAYLKWSGRGCHIHVSEEAFSEDFLKRHHPLDVAFAIVEYVIREIKPELSSLNFEKAKVENKVDIKRVFTLPLSLHRELNYSCVCFTPEDVDSFDLSWADPEQPKHKPAYEKFEVGEADELAEKALSSVGGYFSRLRETLPEEEPAGIGPPKIGRFQVMALLQAARCFLITRDVEKSKSFGLNRAIFYAWAKQRGVKAKKPSGRRGVSKAVEESVSENKVFRLGDEVAYLSEDGWLVIGNIKQTSKDYDNQIVRRVNGIVPYEEAWRRALEYLKGFPKEVLLDQQKFYNQVYRPVRDSFIESVKGGYGSSKLKNED
ncbi:MAG: hypothetical protein ACUVQ0_04815 [Thermoproteota archaeon]